MNFGFRLPGPFRIGVSSRGRVNMGVTVGPLSMSGGIGGAGRKMPQGVFFPVTLDDFVRQAKAEGFSTQLTPGTSATIERRWMAAVARVVPGGVMLRRVWSTWQILALIGGVMLLVLCCCGPGFYDMATNSRTS